MKRHVGRPCGARSAGTRTVAWLLLGVGLLTASMAEAAPKRIGRIDRFWADWEGFDPEAYVMMKEMGDRFSKMEKAASIARDSGDDSLLGQAVRDQLTDEVVDWATDINPAVKPIKTMGEFAMNGTQRWLDWSFRYEVNRMYTTYKAEFNRTGNASQAADAVSRLLDNESETASLAMKEKQLAVLRANRALVIASIIGNHRKYAPEKYEGKDIGRELRGNRPANPSNDPLKPANQKPTDASPKPSATASGTKPPPSATSTAAQKPPTTTAPPYQPVTPALRQTMLDCMCVCSSTANLSMVGVGYDPRPNNASPNCAQPSNGPCINQGIGCWRHAPATSGDCVNRCYSRNNVAPGSVTP